MSIQSEITRLQTAKANLKTSLENKGATVPSNTTLDGYPAIVNNLPNSTKYGATVDSFLGDIDSNGVLYPASTDTYLSFNGVKKMKDYALNHKFYHDYDIDGVSFPDLEELGNSNGMGSYALQNAFSNCTNLTYAYFPKLKHVQATYALNGIFTDCRNLTSINFDSLEYAAENDAFVSAFERTGLTSVSFPRLTYAIGWNNAFNQCGKLTSVSFPALTSVGSTVGFYGCFQSLCSQCYKLTSASFPELTTIESSGNNAFCYTFSSCKSLQTITFPKLEDIPAQYAFQGCFSNASSLTSVSFPSLKSTSFGYNRNQFYNMLSGVTGCTVHFPSNLQSVIGSWSDVTNGFGGTNTTVLFDLPATE